MDTNNSFSATSHAEGFTFDDVLLVPAFSEVLPFQVDISTQLTRNIRLNVPIISAAMDTVSEKKLAIAIAREGGIAIIHKNMSIVEQGEQVRAVKRSESGMIVDPVTLSPDKTVKDAMGLMKHHGIGGIPIVDQTGKLVGILTNRDLRFETDSTRKVSELMTSENLITTKENISLSQAKDILQKHKIEKLPVTDDQNFLRGLITYKDIMKVADFPNACKDSLGRLRVGAAVGVTDDTMERVAELVSKEVDVICVDTAHGHSTGVLQKIKEIKQAFPKLDIIGGNVATGDAAAALIKAGVDGIKVGVGPGSICTTRIVAGVGVPQLSAIQSVSTVAKKHRIPVVGDGGIRYTGDIAKAIAAGADSIMAGSLFAGVDEAPGEAILYDGRKYKVYRGMGSIDAMKKGSKDRYFQSEKESSRKLVPEGIEGMVAYKGTLSEVMLQYVGGLRAAMGYCGAADVTKLKTAQFMRISHASILESHPHNITITKEAPNYSKK